MIHFDLPKDKSSIIKVVGVGGGGSNAVNQMFSDGIEGVNFIVCNTDAQAIASSKVPNKIQLGPNLTQGLGAGANPAIGKEATEESLEEIKKILEVNTKMTFITAGMGGGTGTGGAPIVAKICKELGILTVGIVTTPFGYEGRKRMEQAKIGIEALKANVDTLLVINNDKLRHQYGNLKMSEAFAKADDILATAAKCIVDVINVTGQINLDFADVCTVMRNGGVAILGNAAVAGENRAQLAVEEALNSPLLNDNDIRGAKWILLNINSSQGEFEHTMDEVDIINDYIVQNAGEGVDIIMGQGFDNSLGDKIGITIIATGFEQRDNYSEKVLAEKKIEKVVMKLEQPKEISNQPKASMPSITSATVENSLPALTLVDPAPVAKQVILFDEPTTPKIEEKETPVTRTVLELDRQPLNKVAPSDENVKQYSTQNLQGFLAKPNNIYQSPVTTEKVEEKPAENSAVTNDNTIVWDFSEETTLPKLELIIKDEEPTSEPTNANSSFDAPSSIETASMKESSNANQQEQFVDRTKKLRSLSFNFNNADSDELENVPAYMRRQNEIHNTLAKVEKFYSEYTVNVDENNQAQINVNSKNSFLEGQRPD